VGIISSAIFLFSSSFLRASPIFFIVGTDADAGSAQEVNVAGDAAAVFFHDAESYYAYPSLVSLITFESAPIGSFSSLAVAPGVRITGKACCGSHQSILSSPASPFAPALDGFNISQNGSNFVELNGGSVTFLFYTPTDFFGAYFIGLQQNSTITFSDQNSESFTVPAADPIYGGVTFAGFIDGGATISKITVTAGSSSGDDHFGLDEVFYDAQASPVPEPSTLTMSCVPLFMLAGICWRRRSNRYLHQ